MENLVVDSGICVKWFIQETDSDTAQLILDQYEQRNISFFAPDLIYAEFGNVIWKKQIFQNLDSTDANFAIQEFKKISFTLLSIRSLFDDAYRIAIKYKRTFYDSLYIALAQRENCRFVTADERLVNAVKSDFTGIVLLKDWK